LTNHLTAFLLFLLAATAGAGDEVTNGETGTTGPEIDYFAWADVLWRDADRPDQGEYLEINHVYLGLDGRLSRAWRALVEVEYEHQPDLGVEKVDESVELDRAYLAYQPSAALGFRLGKVNSPAGIWKPLHWTILVDTIAKPIMEDNGYIPDKTLGLEVFGTRVFPYGLLSYTLIGGRVEEDIDAGPELDEATAIGIDLNYRYRDRFTYGASIYRYQNLDDDEINVTGVLPYVDWSILADRLSFRLEALHLHRTNAEDIQAGYAKLKYRFNPRTYLNLRYDQGEDERRLDGFSRRATTLTAGWWPNDHLRFKAEITSNRLTSLAGDDFIEGAVWVGYVIK